MLDGEDRAGVGVGSEGVEGHEVEAVFVAGFVGVDPGVAHVDFDAVLAQAVDDVHDAGVAQVGAVLLEREPEDEYPVGGDGLAVAGHREDELVSDVSAHAVVDAPASEDDFGVVADLLGFVGEVVGVDADAVPADQAGAEGRKFHLVPAASRTSRVSRSRVLNRTASSLIRAMLTSRCVFSMTFAASATRMLLARWVPAVMMLA